MDVAREGVSKSALCCNAIWLPAVQKLIFSCIWSLLIYFWPLYVARSHSSPPWVSSTSPSVQFHKVCNFKTEERVDTGAPQLLLGRATSGKTVLTMQTGRQYCRVSIEQVCLWKESQDMYASY